MLCKQEIGRREKICLSFPKVSLYNEGFST